MAVLRRVAVHDIATDFASPGAQAVVSLWWLGQAGFAVRAGDLRIVIDPYLSDSLAKKYRGTAFPHARLMKPPIAPDELTAVDLVLCTHAHTDHMDAETLTAIAAASPACRFIVPAAELDRALERGVPRERLIGANAEAELSPMGGIRIIGIPSAHEDLKMDAVGRHHFLGYVLAVPGLSLYHSGDCVPYPGLEARLRAYPIDLALLPVNGRDEARRKSGVPGNFHLHEAIQLCQAVGIPLMLGHHFGLFDFNTIDENTARRELESAPKGFDLVATESRYDLSLG